MIRIAFVIDTIVSPTAGTENQLLMLLQGLDRRRFTPYLICLHQSEWLNRKSFPFDVKYFNTPQIISFRFLVKTKAFAQWCDDESIDIVQTFFSDGNKFGTFGARRSKRRPIVISSRRNIGHANGFISNTILRFLKQWTSRYLANSRAAANRAMSSEKLPADIIDVIYNGLDLSRFENTIGQLRQDQRRTWQIETDQILVGMIANLRDVKNIDSLIRVAARLKNDFPTLRFVVVGEGPDREKLQTQIDSNGLTNKFLLAGRHLDILPCLGAFDIAVLCSMFESFSNSLVEYMTAGLPIVASDVGGNSEAITDGETGLLYPVTEDIQLEQALRKLLGDRKFASKLGQNARASAFKRFSQESCLQQHEEYYANLVQAATMAGEKIESL